MRQAKRYFHTKHAHLSRLLSKYKIQYGILLITNHSNINRMHIITRQFGPEILCACRCVAIYIASVEYTSIPALTQTHKHI